MAADVVECPGCYRQLRVPDSLIGHAVKCPACAMTFTAGQAAETARPADGPIPFQADDDPPPVPRPQRRRYEDDEDDDDPRRRSRRDLEPHRGAAVLTLGILGLACIPIIFGPIAWTMGQNDMAEIQAGRMDPEGEGMTNAGRICGIIATVLGLVSLCCMGIQIMAVVSGGR